jgi:hypothetical protein
MLLLTTDNIQFYFKTMRFIFLRTNATYKYFNNEHTMHPASCTMGSGSFPGLKRPGRGADQLPPSSAEVKKV